MKIEKRIELKAPIATVWRALTDSEQFGHWFQVRLEGPFEVGKVTSGKILTPGYEHYHFQALVETMEPTHTFSFRWPHSPEGAKADIATEPTTVVEFVLKEIPGGTLLTVTESGFENLPSDRRLELFRGNEEGWSMQLKNIEAYLEKSTR